MSESSTPREPAVPTAPSSADSAPPPRRPFGAVVLLARLVVAAMVAFVLLHIWHPTFHVPKEYHIVEMGAPVEKVLALQAQQDRVDRLNAMLHCGLLGGLLAAAIALGPPACCPWWKRLSAALPWGLLVGALGGVAAVLLHSGRESATLPTVTDTFEVQATLFGILGAGLGCMLGGFLGTGRRAVTGGIAGAVAGGLAGLVYPLIAAVAMPAISTEPVIPDEVGVRLLWYLTFTVTFCVCLSLAFRPRRELVPLEAG